MKQQIFAAVMLSCSSVSYADSDLRLDVHLTSKHADSGFLSDKGVPIAFNRNNKGIGLSLDINPHLDVGIGTYRNSYYKQSTYLVADVHTMPRNHFRVGLTAGPVTGYSPNSLMLSPNVTFVSKRYNVRFGLLPVNKGVVTLSVGINLY